MSAGLPDPATAGKLQIDAETLCSEFCPPLEAGLVYALASDFDLDDPKCLTELRTALTELRESAAVEQELELLPQYEPGTGAVANAISSDNGVHLPGDIASSRPTKSSIPGSIEDDGVASVTTGISEIKTSDVEDGDLGNATGYGDASAGFEDLPDSEKCKWLSSIFPLVAPLDIQRVLLKCKGDFDRTADELLNVSFLTETSGDHGDQQFAVPKGVDGFLRGDTPNRKRRKGGKRTKNHIQHHDLTETHTSDSAISSGANTPSTRNDVPEDVEYIAIRTYLKPKAITSVYHANGAHIGPTIRALVIREGEVYRSAGHKADEIMEWQMDELRLDFENVPDSQIYGVLMLTNKIPSAAKELLDIMISSNQPPVLLGKVTGLASYTPLDLSEDESTHTRASTNQYFSTVAGSSGSYTTSHLANTHGQAATQAFQQASAAHKRGKSDRFMGGAAAYYASVGHDRLKTAKAVQAQAANTHVAAQSSSTRLDLHGVNVSDAVRIAQDGTEAWWEGLGDRKYVVGGKGDGYRIITGVGRHSADGTSRIGPAVSRTLVREGWKIEVGTGEIVVSGKARRK